MSIIEKLNSIKIFNCFHYSIFFKGDYKFLSVIVVSLLTILYINIQK